MAENVGGFLCPVQCDDGTGQSCKDNRSRCAEEFKEWMLLDVLRGEKNFEKHIDDVAATWANELTDWCEYCPKGCFDMCQGKARKTNECEQTFKKWALEEAEK